MAEVDDVAALVEELGIAARTYDEDEARAAAQRIIDLVHASPEPIDPAEGEAALLLLRKMREFGLMERLGDCFVASGVTSPRIMRLYAQAVIEGGGLVAAQTLLETMIANEPLGSKEGKEFRGLLGRTLKDRYVEIDNPKGAGAAQALLGAIAAYKEVYDADATQIWHGINLAALIDRGQRDGVDVGDAGDAGEIAGAILKHVEGLALEGDTRAWDAATAMEAALLLGKGDQARAWLKTYVEDSGVDAFALAGTLRQLEDVWQLSPEGEWGDLLTVLKTNMMDRGDGHRVEVAKPPPTTDEFESRSGGLEKTFGAVGGVTVKWWTMAMERLQTVARIENKTGRGMGTAFLVRGGDLNPAWGDELVAVTNAHVVSNSPYMRGTLTPPEAVVNFTMLEGVEPIAVKELLYESHPEKLDCAVLRLASPAPDVPPVPLAFGLPAADGDQRLYVMGHPLGGDLKISIDDNVLVDHDNLLVHYRAPTEPGSSGSPVFNREWDLIALHHKGNDHLEKLNDHRGEFYKANEGVSFFAIKEECAGPPVAADASG